MLPSATLPSYPRKIGVTSAIPNPNFSSPNNSPINPIYPQIPFLNEVITTYKGETKNGKRHGQGVYLYPNGDMYDGGWRKSRKYGKGVYIYADGHRCATF